MFMPLFLSTYANKIDKKGRVSVPAPFRASLAGQSYQGVVLFKATSHPCIEGFDFATMEELSARLDHFDLFSNQQDDLATAIFAEAVQCPFDSEGRIGVPMPLLEFAQISEAATFVGLGRKFQIWDSVAFEARRQSAREGVIREGLTLPKLETGRGNQ
jgi:MraZ protein